MKMNELKIDKRINNKKGISLVTLCVIIGILIVLAVIAGVLTWFFRKDAIEAKKVEMYIADRNKVQQALVEATTKVQQKYNVTVSVIEKKDISTGIVYELKGLNNSAITGGKIGWKTKATDATTTQDISIVLGIDMPVYEENYMWSTDVRGNIVLTVKEKQYTAPDGVNLNATLKNLSTSQGEGTKNIDIAKQNKIPYVPTGFSHISGTTIENGYIIQDSQIEPNQYVWIPVKSMKNWPDKVNEYYTKELEEYLAVRKSVETYGGFYIGRFEASNDNLRAASRIDKKPWTNITWSDSQKELNGGATYYARQVKSDYGYVDFKSCLVYESQWKDILDFLSKTDDKDSSGWGNYLESSFNITRNGAMYAIMKPDLTLGEFQSARGGIEKPKSNATIDEKEEKYETGGWVTTTGSTNVHCVKNIYDIAGNVSEWTMGSSSSDTRKIAGGSYKDFASEVPASKIKEQKIAQKAENIGFRVSLYL